MGLFGKKKKRQPFLLPFCVPMGGHKGGGITKKIKEGYTVSGISGKPGYYSVLVMVSRDRVFPVFNSLATYVREPFKVAIENHQEETPLIYTSDSINLQKTLKTFKKYSFQLVNDGFTAFGIGSKEYSIYVGDHKDLKLICKSSKDAIDVMNQYDIPMDDKLQWIGTGPHYHFPIIALFIEETISRMCEPPPTEEATKFNENPDAYSKFFEAIISELDLKPLKYVE